MIYLGIQHVAEADAPLSDPCCLRLGLFNFRIDFFLQLWISMLWISIAWEPGLRLWTEQNRWKRSWNPECDLHNFVTRKACRWGNGFSGQGTWRIGELENEWGSWDLTRKRMDKLFRVESRSHHDDAAFMIAFAAGMWCNWRTLGYLWRSLYNYPLWSRESIA